MNKAVTIIVSMAVISLLTLGLLQAQSGSLNIQPIEGAAKVSEQVGLPEQNQNPNVEKTSQLSVAEDQSTLDSSCKTQEQQTLNDNESSNLISNTTQNQTTGPAVPFPDGRIFLTTQTEPGDAIPYIPTENPKATSGIPLAPLEPDA